MSESALPDIVKRDAPAPPDKTSERQAAASFKIFTQIGKEATKNNSINRTLLSKEKVCKQRLVLSRIGGLMF